jgi:hypothetical protein
MDEQALTDPGTHAIAPGEHMALFTELSSQLAAELVAKLQPADEILNRYGLTTQDFSRLAATPAFKQMLKEAKITWESDMNAQERIRAKAAVIAEESLVVLHQIIHNSELPAPNRMDAIKHASTLADALPRKEGEGGGSNKFTVNIDLSGKDPETGKIVGNKLSIEGDTVDDE